MKTLIVVDMQNDFINGSLGTKEAQAIVPKVVDRINYYRENGWDVIFTMDTHGSDYLQTLEGQKLPVEHCIAGTDGWQLHPALQDLVFDKDRVVMKNTFGYDWSDNWDFEEDEEIEFCGLCTDICVISNALILRREYPNKPMSVNAACCAGVTPEKHLAALEVMKSCQIDVIND